MGEPRRSLCRKGDPSSAQQSKNKAPERKLPVKPGRKCRLVGAEPMIGAETENENKTFGPSGGAWFEIDRSEANKRATLNQLCPPRA